MISPLRHGFRYTLHMNSIGGIVQFSHDLEVWLRYRRFESSRLGLLENFHSRLHRFRYACVRVSGSREGKLPGRRSRAVAWFGRRVLQWGCASCLIAAVACAPNYATLPPAAVAEAVEIAAADDEAGVLYVAPTLTAKTYRAWALGYDYAYYSLRGQGRVAGSPAHWLCVSIAYAGDRRRYSMAQLAPGHEPVEVALTSETKDCYTYPPEHEHRESFRIPLAHTLIMEHADRGLVVKVLAASGHENTLTLPPSYLQGYLQAVITDGVGKHGRRSNPR